MSGIYGETLLAFPEQTHTITVYKMSAGFNGGWTKDLDSEISATGIYQNTSGNQTTDSNGNLVETAGLEFWSKTGKLNGYFTTIEGIVYRLNRSNNWSFEGGFWRYSLEKVVGNNGTEPINTSWNIGTNSFG